MSEFQPPTGGYGRIWEQMYEGSLAGSGAEVFCLWPYAVTKMRLSKGVGAVVMLNPQVLRGIFGVADEAFVQRGIDKLCAPDPQTKNGHEQEGRRLVKLSGHLYLVVNGAEYMAIRAKERHADAQARYREKQKGKKPGKSAGQVRAENDDRQKRHEEAERNGNAELAGLIAAEGLPPVPEPLRDPPEHGGAPTTLDEPPEEDLPGPEYQGSDEEPLA